jgi:hypothetical protein
MKVVARRPTCRKEGAVESFITRLGSQVTAVLSGFDRLVFRGTLLPLMRQYGMFHFLEHAGVRLLDFKKYVTSTSERGA